ncbi:helix-turn-helix transcriptional regulator [Aeromonas rivuli]|uniref:helix-turn-helix transcriptional regulator n=1 Tax=Aeromonas rivuli TaxID=648794 RepID=UPI001CCFBFFF|nr:AlpA family phage regulatory protein [Aeromonas rivuli]UBO72982.1 AlpA family phage regulatory protein [Aeromonas rivuli]
MNMNSTAAGAARVVRIKELVTILGLSRSTIYNKLNASSKAYDDGFPKPIRLGAASVGWMLTEVYAWLQSRSQLSISAAMKED